MSDEELTYQEAIELPFDEYIQWCNVYIKRRSAQNPIIGDIFEYGAPMLQALWAKRYWYHHCDKQNSDYI